MKNDKADRNFPAIHLAAGPLADPAKTHKRILSELAGCRNVMAWREHIEQRAVDLLQAVESEDLR